MPWLLQYPDGRERREGRVTVVRAAAPVEPLAAQHRRPGAESLVPAGHLRLLVHVAVEQHGVVDIARNLDEEQRRPPRKLDDLKLHALRRMRPAPLDDERHRLVHMAVARPVRIEVGRLVRDPDVIDQRRDDRLVELVRDERLRLPCVDRLVHGHGRDYACSCGRGATPEGTDISRFSRLATLRWPDRQEIAPAEVATLGHEGSPPTTMRTGCWQPASAGRSGCGAMTVGRLR